MLCIKFQNAEEMSFVIKKPTHQKPSQIKQDIAEIFELMLTQCCDMIGSITRQQRFIIQHIKNLAQGTGALSEKNLQDLKKCKEELARIKQECNKQMSLLEKDIKILESML